MMEKLYNIYSKEFGLDDEHIERLTGEKKGLIPIAAEQVLETRYSQNGDFACDFDKINKKLGITNSEEIFNQAKKIIQGAININELGFSHRVNIYLISEFEKKEGMKPLFWEELRFFMRFRVCNIGARSASQIIEKISEVTGLSFEDMKRCTLYRAYR